MQCSYSASVVDKATILAWLLYTIQRKFLMVENFDESVFTTTALTPILKNLTIKTKEEIWKKWYKKWNARRISQPYIANMGNYCSESLAVCLHNKGITYGQLQAAFVTHNSEEYDKWMKGVGVRLKKWRNNIQNHFISIAIFLLIRTSGINIIAMH